MEVIRNRSRGRSRVVPGIYANRTETVDGETITVYDIRIANLASTSVFLMKDIVEESILGDPDWRDQFVRCDIMEDQNGLHLTVKGSRAPRELFEPVYNAFLVAERHGEAPGKLPEHCSQSHMMRVARCRQDAKKFVAYLKAHREDPAIYTAPLH